MMLPTEIENDFEVCHCGIIRPCYRHDKEEEFRDMENAGETPYGEVAVWRSTAPQLEK